jgi:hypothetical protein
MNYVCVRATTGAHMNTQVQQSEKGISVDGCEEKQRESQQN